MSDVETLVDKIRATGHSLVLVDGKLIFTALYGTSTTLKNAILADLRRCKPEVVAYLESSKIEALIAGNQAGFESYEVEPGVFLHSPITSPDFLAWRERMSVKR
jgi:hypothetical protein